MVVTDNLLGGRSWVPWMIQEGGYDIELLSGIAAACSTACGVVRKLHSAISWKRLSPFDQFQTIRLAFLGTLLGFSFSHSFIMHERSMSI